MQCPVAHGAASGTVGEPGQCPVIHKLTDHAHPTEAPKVDVDEIDENPSVAEYKRLRKVMLQITKFYRSGSELKQKNMENMKEQVKKLEVDQAMAKAQLEVLDSKPAFKIHPKAKEYKKPLLEELEGLKKQKDGFLAKEDEFKGLFEWSKTIVEICEWLESSLDDYCRTKLQLPASALPANHVAPRDLSPEEVKSYSRGLDEIIYNLQESQDFFAASIDGRLQKYHEIEKALIEAQIEALKEFPENDRRLYIQSELEKDLDYVMGNMATTPDNERRRHKMLKSHQEYLHVLRYQREKLKLLNVDLSEERKFDSRFDLYQDN